VREESKVGMMSNVRDDLNEGGPTPFRVFLPVRGHCIVPSYGLVQYFATRPSLKIRCSITALKP
jgi:hypothetical protein